MFRNMFKIKIYDEFDQKVATFKNVPDKLKHSVDEFMEKFE